MPGLTSVSMVSGVDELLDSEAKCSNYICRDINRLRVVSHFSSEIVKRAKRERS